MWQRRLAELQADIALSPTVMDGMPYTQTNSVGSPTEKKAIKLAEVAKVRNYTRPEITDSDRALNIVGGRHPVVEAVSKELLADEIVRAESVEGEELDINGKNVVISVRKVQK